MAACTTGLAAVGAATSLLPTRYVMLALLGAAASVLAAREARTLAAVSAARPEAQIVYPRMSRLVAEAALLTAVLIALAFTSAQTGVFLVVIGAAAIVSASIDALILAYRKRVADSETREV